MTQAPGGQDGVTAIETGWMHRYNAAFRAAHNTPLRALGEKGGACTIGEVGRVATNGPDPSPCHH